MNTCRAHTVTSVCGLHLPCPIHAPGQPKAPAIACATCGGDHPQPWPGRLIAMRAARRLADKLEAIAEDGAQGASAGSEDTERLDAAFRRLQAQLGDLVRGCP